MRDLGMFIHSFDLRCIPLLLVQQAMMRTSKRMNERENRCCDGFMSLSAIMKHGYESNTHSRAHICPAFIRPYIFSHVKKIWIWNWRSVPTEACVYTRHPRPRTHLCVQSGREMFFFFKLPLLLFSHGNDEKRISRERRIQTETLDI